MRHTSTRIAGSTISRHHATPGKKNQDEDEAPHRPNSAAPVRALTAHLFRYLTQPLTRGQLRHFLELCLPHVPGAADLCGSVFTLRDWVHKYDDDAFDANLQGMGLAKIVWPADFGDADERVNGLVVEKLVNLQREELANATSSVMFTLLHEAQDELGVWHYRRGLSWACTRRREAMEKYHPSASSRLDDDEVATQVKLTSIPASVVDIFDDWHGPIPDCNILHSREEIGGEVFSTRVSASGDEDHGDQTIVMETLDRDEYLEMVILVEKVCAVFCQWSMFP